MHTVYGNGDASTGDVQVSNDKSSLTSSPNNNSVTVAGGAALLSVTAAANPIDLRGATVTGIGLGDNQAVAPGDTVQLIYAANSDLAHLTPASVTPVTSAAAAGLTTTWKLLPGAPDLSALLTTMATTGDPARPGGYTVHATATDAVTLTNTSA